MAKTLIQFREDELKIQKASAICQQLGTDLITYLHICIDRLNNEGVFPFSMTLENQTLKRGREALKHIRQIAEENCISDMSLDEINAEIAEARKKP